MAAVTRILLHCGVSRQFSRDFLRRYVLNDCCETKRRWLSMLVFHRLAVLTQTLDKPKSYSVQTVLEYNVNETVTKIASCDELKQLHTRAMCTTFSDDQEFVSESLVIADENAADLTYFSEVITKVKAKTGVIVKTFNEDDMIDKRGLKVFLGGTRHEVKKAVSYMKSLLNKEPSKQNKSDMFQDEELNRQHLGKKAKPIWAFYRRNFKGQKPPMRTRKKCIRGRGESQIVSGNPCAICRLYLGGGYELDYKDIDLLSQFISPHTGEVFEATKTGVCRLQQEKLIKAIETAKDFGLLSYSIPGPRSIVKPPEQAKIPINVRLK